MIEVPESVDSVVLDVNSLAIGLTDNHPAHDYLRPFLEDGIDGDIELLIFDYLPLRAQHVMVTEFGVHVVDARNAIQSFLRSPVKVVSASKETLLKSYEISVEKNHDAYDCFFVSLARSHDADCVLTADTDFEKLCENEEIRYLNPVPDSVLKNFDELSG